MKVKRLTGDPVVSHSGGEEPQWHRSNLTGLRRQQLKERMQAGGDLAHLSAVEREAQLAAEAELDGSGIHGNLTACPTSDALRQVTFFYLSSESTGTNDRSFERWKAEWAGRICSANWT